MYVFSLCGYYAPLENWNSTKFPLPVDDLYQVELNLAQWFWTRRLSKVQYVAIISPLIDA